MQGGSPAPLFSFAGTRRRGVGSQQPSQPPPCLLPIRAVGPSSCREAAGRRLEQLLPRLPARSGFHQLRSYVPASYPVCLPGRAVVDSQRRRGTRKTAPRPRNEDPLPRFLLSGTTPSRAEGLGRLFPARGGCKGHAEPGTFGRGLGAPDTSLISAQSPRLGFWQGSASTGGSAGLCPRWAACRDVSEEPSALAAAQSGSAQRGGADLGHALAGAPSPGSALRDLAPPVSLPPPAQPPPSKRFSPLVLLPKVSALRP